MLAVFQVVGNRGMCFTFPQPQKILLLVILLSSCFGLFFVNEVIVLLDDPIHTL